MLRRHSCGRTENHVYERGKSLVLYLANVMEDAKESGWITNAARDAQIVKLLAMFRNFVKTQIIDCAGINASLILAAWNYRLADLISGFKRHLQDERDEKRAMLKLLHEKLFVAVFVLEKESSVFKMIRNDIIAAIDLDMISVASADSGWRRERLARETEIRQRNLATQPLYIAMRKTSRKLDQLLETIGNKTPWIVADAFPRTWAAIGALNQFLHEELTK